jgi:putative Mn2+ efflux pump MntP
MARRGGNGVDPSGVRITLYGIVGVVMSFFGASFVPYWWIVLIGSFLFIIIGVYFIIRDSK